LNDMINSYNQQLNKTINNQEIFQSQQQSHPLSSQNSNINSNLSISNNNNKFNYSDLQHLHQQFLMAQQQQNRFLDLNNNNNNINNTNEIESNEQNKKHKQFQSSPFSDSSASSLSNVSISDSSNSASSPENKTKKSMNFTNSYDFASNNGYQIPATPISYYQSKLKLNPASIAAASVTSPLFAAAAVAAHNNPAAMFINPFTYYATDPSSLFMMNKNDSNSSMSYHQHINNNSNNNVNKRPKSTFPFGKCKVCNDKATGIHYGIATCEGCKVSLKFYS